MVSKVFGTSQSISELLAIETPYSDVYLLLQRNHDLNVGK